MHRHAYKAASIAFCLSKYVNSLRNWDKVTSFRCSTESISSSFAAERSSRVRETKVGSAGPGADFAVRGALVLRRGGGCRSPLGAWDGPGTSLMSSAAGERGWDSNFVRLSSLEAVMAAVMGWSRWTVGWETW